MGKKITSSENQLRSQYDLRTIRVAARSDRTALSANDSHEGNTPLGEVRVKVKLTNAVDEALVRRGLLTADKIRSYEADALVDTGAVRSVLPIHVVQLLGWLSSIKQEPPTPMTRQKTSTSLKWSALHYLVVAPLKKRWCWAPKC